MKDERISEFLSILLSSLLVAALCLLIEKYFGYLDAPSLDARFTFLVTHPENVERLQYVIGSAVFAVSLGTLNWFLICNVKGKFDKFLYIIIVGILFALIYVDLSANPFYLQYLPSLNFRSVVALLGIAAISLILGARFLDAMALFVIASLSYMQVYGIGYVDDSGSFTSHLSAYFYSISQVYMGKPLLLDGFVNQYGLYPQLLEPIFRIIGLDILKFTSVMAVLLAISFLCIYAFLRDAVDNKLIAFSGFIMILFYNFLLSKILFADPYFQFYPHRLIFPTMLIILSYYYFKGDTWLYYPSFFLYSIAVLWNPDTGIVVFGAWMLSLVYGEFLQPNATRGAAKHILTGATVFSSTIIAYEFYIFLRYGAFPDFGSLFAYMLYFSESGLGMLPMPLIHPWNFVLLIYAVGLSHSARYLIASEDTTKARMTFLLSVLGLGVFLYYQGRSHDFNLLHIMYPALILLVLCADDLFKRIKSGSRDALELVVFGLITLLLVSSNLSFSDNYHAVQEITAIRQQNNLPTNVTKNIEFIKENTHPGERVLFVSPNEGIYYAETKTESALNIPGYAELILVDDFNKLANYTGNKLFLSDDFSTASVLFDKGFIIEEIYKNYTLEKRIGEMGLYRRC